MVKYSRDKNLIPRRDFETERLRLTPLAAEHEPGMWEMFSDKEFTRYVPFEHFTDREEARADYLAKIEAGERFKFHYAILWRESGEMAGFAMSRPTEDGKYMEIGYCTTPRFWGQGVSTEILQLLVDVIAPEMGADKTDVAARISHDNAASIRVVEKCGFQLDHEVLDDENPHQVYLWRG